jgi:RNA polymerase-interacting CarD/CdnL/TRCF family regulator
VANTTTNNVQSFTEDEWIVHSHHGVGHIEEIERKRISGQEHAYLRVKLIDGTIWLPVDQMDDDQIRPVTEEEDFQKAVEVFNNPPREMDSNYRTRNSRIKNVLLNNTPISTARLIRDLRARRRVKGGLNQSERRALKELTRRFVQEWAVCQDITIEQARHTLKRKLGVKRLNGRARRSRKNSRKLKNLSPLEALIRQDDRWARWLNQKTSQTNGEEVNAHRLQSD